MMEWEVFDEVDEDWNETQKDVTNYEMSDLNYQKISFKKILIPSLSNYFILSLFFTLPEYPLLVREMHILSRANL
jgi:hypothetical protein